MRKGHIAAVEFLTAGTDEDLIEQGSEIFRELSDRNRFDGFEIWDGARRVHVHPVEVEDQNQS